MYFIFALKCNLLLLW